MREMFVRVAMMAARFCKAICSGSYSDLCQDFGHFCLRFYAAKGSTSQAFKVLSKNASITSAGTR